MLEAEMSGKQLSNVSPESRSGVDNVYRSSKKHWCSSSKLEVMMSFLRWLLILKFGRVNAKLEQ